MSQTYYCVYCVWAPWPIMDYAHGIPEHVHGGRRSRPGLENRLIQSDRAGLGRIDGNIPSPKFQIRKFDQRAYILELE